MLGLLLLCCSEPQDADGPEKSIARTAALANYASTVRIKVEGIFHPSVADPAPMQIRVEEGKPWAFSGEKFEAYRLGRTMVLKDPKGGWRKYSDVPPVSGGAAPSRQHFASMMVQYLEVPHECLGSMMSKVAKFEFVEVVGSTRVYSGPMTAEAAMEYGLTGQEKKWPKESSNRSSIEVSGTVTLWIGKAGFVEKYELSTLVTGKKGERALKRKRNQIVEISGVGTTRYEVPKEASKALGD
jgi:hypothetical protein